MATTSGTCHDCNAPLPIGPDSRFDIGGDDYCFPCLKTPMDALIASAAGFPCVVNGVSLDPGMLPSALFGGAVAYETYKNLFDMKKTEWATPLARRLYCNGRQPPHPRMFVGALTDFTTDHETTFAGCGICGRVRCMKCGGVTDESRDSIRDHLHGWNQDN